MKRWMQVLWGALFFGVGFLAVGAEEGLPGLRPLWEVGLFNGVATIPHYRGSDQSDEYFIPLPFLIYRGEVLEADRDGFRGVLYHRKRIKTTLSFFFKPPLNRDNEAREGMDDLEALFEVGPALEVMLWEGGAQRFVWKSEFRGVSGLDGADVEHVGWRGRSRLIWRHVDVLGDDALRVGLNAAFEWGSSEYHSYFYAVGDEDVLDGRPLYRVGSGYSGFSFSGNMMYRVHERWSFGCFANWDYIAGAGFEESPLVRQDYNVTAGLAIIWRIAESERLERR